MCGIVGSENVSLCYSVPMHSRNCISNKTQFINIVDFSINKLNASILGLWKKQLKEFIRSIIFTLRDFPLVEAKCFCCCFASIMKSYSFWIDPVLDCGISSFVLCCNAILCHDFVMIYSSQPFLF